MAFARRKPGWDSAQPGDHRQLVASSQALRFQVRARCQEFSGDFIGRIQMANALLGFLAHPLPVMAHIFGEPLGALPLALPERDLS